MVKDGKRRVQITLSEEVLKELEKAAKKAGVTKSALASVAITDWITQKKINE